MPQKKSKPAKASIAKSGAQAGKRPRRLRLAKYKSFRLSKRIKPEIVEPKALPPARKIFIGSCSILLNNWKLFGGILLIFLLLDAIVIGGVGGGDLQMMRDNIGDVFTGQFSQVTGGLALFTFLLTSGSGTSESSPYQALLLLVVSLALIWALRQAYAQTKKSKIRIRDAFYRGVYPLVTFMLVLLVVGIQLIPFIVGDFLFNILVGGGIAATTIEQVICGIVFALLAILSLYMILSSMFALYIVTLPDMTPMKALRSARELVRYRRLKLFRKLLFLPFALIIVAAVIMIPLIMLLTPAAPIIFFALTAVGLAVVHSYMYGLYRELIA